MVPDNLQSSNEHHAFTALGDRLTFTTHEKLVVIVSQLDIPVNSLALILNFPLVATETGRIDICADSRSRHCAGMIFKMAAGSEICFSRHRNTMRTALFFLTQTPPD